jgi:hypothetical protein
VKRIEQPEVTRDRWGRPVIDGVTYLRPSSVAKQLDDNSNLIEWAAGMTALGMGRSPDLVALASTKKDWKACKEISKRARDRAGSGAGRDMGTAIHEATEALDYGEDVSHLPSDLLKDAQAYVAARESLNLDPLAAEVFVVNRQIGAAGTFDRLVGANAEIVGLGFWEPYTNTLITDIKTTKWEEGQDPYAAAEYAAKYNALSWSIQLATYSRAEPHGATWGDLGGAPSLNTGIVWCIPRGSGVCVPVWLDLQAGWGFAQTAMSVYDARKANPVIAIDEAVSA